MKAPKIALAAALSLAALAGESQIVVKDGETVAFMGDSITQFGNYPVGYVNLVMKGLEVAGVKNAKKIPVGISGHKSNDMHARLNRDVLARKDGQRAQWMTFNCGVNDVWHSDWGKGVPLDHYKMHVSAIFDACAASNVNVIVLTPTMITENPKEAKNAKLAPYVEWIRAEAAKRKLLCADLNAIMQEKVAAARAAGKTGNTLTCDGVHMAYEGNKMMAWGVLRAMGVPADKEAACVAAWDKMPGYYEMKLPLSKVETDALRRRLADEKTAEADLIRKLLGFK